MTNVKAKRVLIVEDDEISLMTLGRFLEKQGLAVEYESNGNLAVQRILDLMPDVVVLDGMLPGKDGFDICREVRDRYRGPILMLTARGEDLDQVVGLELGADDYILNPAQPRVVLARIRACLRRAGAALPEAQDEFVFGRFRINRASRTVHLDKSEVPLKTAEFDLLWLLASNAGTILSRDDIQSKLRGIEHDGLDRSIDMRISRLRKSLGDDADNPTRIKTVRAKGYLFSRTDWD